MVFSFEQVEKCKITVQELALFGVDFVDFGNWPEGEKNRRYRVMIRVAASIFGYWKDCDISSCRRARCCRPVEKAAVGPSDYLPPCVRCDDLERMKEIDEAPERIWGREPRRRNEPRPRLAAPNNCSFHGLGRSFVRPEKRCGGRRRNRRRSNFRCYGLAADTILHYIAGHRYC